jgi:hypothetical protein
MQHVHATTSTECCSERKASRSYHCLISKCIFLAKRIESQIQIASSSVSDIQEHMLCSLSLVLA